MSKDKHDIENWELELRKEVGQMTEPTDEADFQEFMEKLEDTGYFKKKKRRGFFWLIFGLLAIFIGTVLFTQKDEPKSEELIMEQSVQDNVKPEVLETVPESETVIEQKQEETVEAFTPAANIDKNEVKKEQVIAPKEQEEEVVSSEAPASIQEIQNPVEQPIVEPEPVKEEAVTPKQQPKPVVKKVIIMSSDTTMINDTTHVKKRRRKKK